MNCMYQVPGGSRRVADALASSRLRGRRSSPRSRDKSTLRRQQRRIHCNPLRLGERFADLIRASHLGVTCLSDEASKTRDRMTLRLRPSTQGRRTHRRALRWLWLVEVTNDRHESVAASHRGAGPSMRENDEAPHRCPRRSGQSGLWRQRVDHRRRESACRASRIPCGRQARVVRWGGRLNGRSLKSAFV